MTWVVQVIDALRAEELCSGLSSDRLVFLERKKPTGLLGNRGYIPEKKCSQEENLSVLTRMKIALCGASWIPQKRKIGLPQV